MNFKEKYRAANEEIHGDKSILTGIADAKPKKIIYFKPVMGTAVAAVICLVTVILYPYIAVKTPADKENLAGISKDIFVTSEQTEGLSVSEEEHSQQPAVWARTVPEAGENVATAAENTTESTPAYSDGKPKASVNAAFTEESQDEAEIQNIETETIDSAEEKIVGVTEDCESEIDVNSKNGDVTFDKNSSAAAGGGGGSSAASQNVRYVISENMTFVTAYHSNGAEIVYKITEKTLFVNQNGENVAPGEIIKKEILKVEILDELVVKIVLK